MTLLVDVLSYVPSINPSLDQAYLELMVGLVVPGLERLPEPDGRVPVLLPAQRPRQTVLPAVEGVEAGRRPGNRKENN